jgi:hypothetical protein
MRNRPTRNNGVWGTRKSRAGCRLEALRGSGQAGATKKGKADPSLALGRARLRSYARAQLALGRAETRSLVMTAVEAAERCGTDPHANNGVWAPAKPAPRIWRSRQCRAEKRANDGFAHAKTRPVGRENAAKTGWRRRMRRRSKIQMGLIETLRLVLHNRYGYSCAARGCDAPGSRKSKTKEAILDGRKKHH